MPSAQQIAFDLRRLLSSGGFGALACRVLGSLHLPITDEKPTLPCPPKP